MPERASGPAELVRAAGGIVVREGDAGAEVLLVHRPKYDDWTFPKGKAEPGESARACALREVEEETSLACALVRELPSTEYVDGKGRPKRVRYWLMDPGDGVPRPAHEVDALRWTPVAEARGLLSYARDRSLLDAL